MSMLHSLSRRRCMIGMAAVACALLILPDLSSSQPLNNPQWIVELQKQLGNCIAFVDGFDDSPSAAAWTCEDIFEVHAF